MTKVFHQPTILLVNPESSPKALTGSVLFERLAVMCMRSETLPQLPNSAIGLTRALNRSTGDLGALESVILADPSLATAILKAANSSLFGRGQVASVKEAIARLGTNALKNLAFSFAVTALSHKVEATETFNPIRHSRHSLFVAYASCGILKNLKSSRLRYDDVFSAAILHDLHHIVLATIAPLIWQKVTQYASEQQQSYDAAFKAVCLHDPYKLTFFAFNAWMFPEEFVSITELFHHPYNELVDHRTASYLKGADAVAHRNGFSCEPWEVIDSQYDKAIETLELTQLDQFQIIDTATKQTDSHFVNESPHLKAA